MKTKEKFKDWDLTIFKNIYNNWVVYVQRKVGGKIKFINFEHRLRDETVIKAKEYVNSQSL